MESSVDPPRVTRLNVFPIKSCRPVHMYEVDIDTYGVAGDRRFMVMDGNGRFVSQRRLSILATVTAKYVVENDKQLLSVSAPTVSWELKHEPILEGERINASVWDSQVRVIDQGELPAKWLSELFGHGSTFYRLVASAEFSTSSEKYHRLIRKMPESLQQKLPPREIALTDAAPVSIVSHESLTNLNKHMLERGVEEVPLIRFRMNIEIDGCSEPFEEDEWLLIKIGSVPFLVYVDSEVSCEMSGWLMHSARIVISASLVIMKCYLLFFE